MQQQLSVLHQSFPGRSRNCDWGDRLVVAVRGHWCYRYRQVAATVQVLPRFYRVAKCKIVERSK